MFGNGDWHAIFALHAHKWRGCRNVNGCGLYFVRVGDRRHAGTSGLGGKKSLKYLKSGFFFEEAHPPTLYAPLERKGGTMAEQEVHRKCAARASKSEIHRRGYLRAMKLWSLTGGCQARAISLASIYHYVGQRAIVESLALYAVNSL